MEPESEGQVLDVIGSETRRKILEFLSERPHYISEISKRLDITQPAVLKHLAILSKAGLLESFMEENRLGARRKYYVISKSITVQVAINPRNFKVTQHPSEIICPVDIYNNKERIMREITDEINEEKDVTGKAVKARALMREADTLLDCKYFNEDDWNCRSCHNVASVRKQASRIILDASSGDISKGLLTLTSLVDFVLRSTG